MNLATIDIVIFAGYVLALIAIASWVSREKPGHQKNTNDYCDQYSKGFEVNHAPLPHAHIPH